jgi:hypothetical protein
LRPAVCQFVLRATGRWNSRRVRRRQPYRDLFPVLHVKTTRWRQPSTDRPQWRMNCRGKLTEFCRLSVDDSNPSHQLRTESLVHNTEIKNFRPETGARSSPDRELNPKNRDSETRPHEANPRNCRYYLCEAEVPRRDGTGWLGWEDSNSQMSF